MITPAKDIVDLYERHAKAWVQARLVQSTLYERGWLDRFRALIPPAGSILDLGCGAGEPIARHFSDHGHPITGVDSSPTMIATFQTRLPRHQARIADMRTLSLTQRFQGILAWDSFFHLTPDNQRRMFPIFQAHAAPGAALMFTSGPTHGEAIGQLEGDPLYHASLDPLEYQTRLDTAGFAIIATRAEDPTCGGRTVWLAQLR